MNSRFSHIARLVVFALAASAQGAPIPIINHSFEDPVLADGAFVFQTPGWMRTDTFCGVFNPSSAAFPGGAPDGQNVAFLDGVSQLIYRTDAVLQPNTIYTLTVDYGSQLSFAGISPFIQIRARSNVVAASNPALAPAPAGTFQTLSISFATGDQHPFLGQTIDIVLDTGSTGVQVDYDNVRLDASPETFFVDCVTPRQLIKSPGPDQTDFGRGLAVSDDTAAVFGGPDQTLHFYSRAGESWVLGQTLATPLTIAPEPLPMAIEGDTLLVSSPFEGGGATAAGSVHVFQRTAGVWAFDETLIAEVPTFNNRFGAAVDIQGDRILIGAPNENSGHGSAAVFRRSGGTWTIEQTLVPAGSGNNLFGMAVAIDGEYAFLGSQVNTVAVFKRSGNTWTQVDSLSGAPSTAFGFSLDADDGVLIVGASEEDVLEAPGSSSHGAVYFYRLFNGQWVFEQRLTDVDPVHGERFATAVRISRGRAVVLAPNEDDFDGTFGSISVFQRGVFNWSLLKKVERITVFSSDITRSIALGGRSILLTDNVQDPLLAGPRRLVAAIDLDAPAITQQPQSQSAGVGDEVAFTIQTIAQHTAFQWRKDGAPLIDGGGIFGATTNFLVLDPVTASHAGIYDCVVSSSVGCESVLSKQAFLNVGNTAPACPGDANSNGEVEFSDITFVLQNWGGMCP